MEKAFKYNDILNMPRHISKTRPHMSNHDRAAQFMPFAALTGFGAMINEASRLTSEKHELTEEEARLLNERLRIIKSKIKLHPKISLTYFIPDKRKSGGSYETFTGNLRRIDEFNGELIFTDKTVILIDDILLIDFSEEDL